MLLLIFGWSVIMAGIIFVSNRYWKGGSAREAEWNTTSRENQLSDEDFEFLNRYAQYCDQAVHHVISNNTPEQISQFVINPPQSFADIARFYPMNPGIQILDPRLQRVAMSVIRLPEGPAIEGRWLSEDGQLIEAVFRQVDQELLLDWHHFVRFSQHPWALFLAGAGPNQAEFRLLARQRLTRMILDDSSERPLSVVFHAPRFGRPDDPGPPSPPFDLDWDSDAARMLMAGFNQARSGVRPFSSLLPSLESDDEMIRVRVVIRRIDEEEERRFEIVEVPACHWLQHDDTGISGDHLPQ